jgi:hypothetical protein
MKTAREVSSKELKRTCNTVRREGSYMVKLDNTRKQKEQTMKRTRLTRGKSKLKKKIQRQTIGTGQAG